MTDPFIVSVTEVEIKREREKARALRKTRWWKQKLSRGICYYCGRHFSPNELTMDHIIPIIRGGRSIKNNIATACKDCNNKKKHMLPMEWEEYIANLTRKDDSL